MNVSIFNKFTQFQGNKNILEVLNDIKTGVFKNQVEEIRAALHQGDNHLGDSLKKQLQGFTTSGTFSNGRKAQLIEEYSNMLVIDIDKLSPDQLSHSKNLTMLAPYTFASFVSPSGNGLKIIVKVDCPKEHHDQAFKQVAEYYQQTLYIEIDQSGKDISRLCFMSYDPDCFIKENAEVFHVDVAQVAQPEPPKEKPQAVKSTAHSLTSVATDENNSYETFEKCIQFTNQKSTYSEGNRNNYIHLLACNCNRHGIFEENTIDWIMQNFDLAPNEIQATVRSVYSSNLAEFAKSAKIVNENANEQKSKEEESNMMDEVLKTTPFIPDSVYPNLPALLRECTEVFDDKRERDVFLISALSVISGCLPNVSGLYFNSTVYPNLFSFVLAPPASGKGSMIFAKKLGDGIHKAFVEESETNQNDYNVELREYKKRHHGSKGNNANPEEEEPKKPPFKLLYIPANSSTAKVYQHLDHNEGKGIICETEADALGIVFKSDWGSYSDMLRRAFHHETVSISRKTDNQFLEVLEPRIAIVLTGTPNQIMNIVKSAEDGLFSRFFFYTFSTDPVWKSPAPNPNKPNLSEFFGHKGNGLKDIYNYLETTKTEIELTPEQWNRFNDYFQIIIAESNDLISAEATSIVKRHGLMLFRLCLIFSALRKMEYGDDSKTITCEDIDFENAITIIKTVFQHSIIIYSNLPGVQNEFKITKRTRKEQFLLNLPEGEFRRKEAIEIGKKLEISERTVDDLITKKWLNVHVEKIDTGIYRKIA